MQKAWTSREEEVISDAEGRENSGLSSAPLLLVMGVEERAAFTKDRRNIIREKPGFKVPEEVACV